MGPDLMRLLTQAERLLARRLSAILQDDGCSTDAWRVLSLLADGAGHPMTEVAEAAFLPPGTLTKLVDHLVEQNLVYRRVDPADRRRIRAYLTARGRLLHQRISVAVQESIDELRCEDSELLGRLLGGLVDALTRQPVAT